MKPSSYSPSAKPRSNHPPVAPSQRPAREPKLSDDPTVSRLFRSPSAVASARRWVDGGGVMLRHHPQNLSPQADPRGAGPKRIGNHKIRTCRGRSWHHQCRNGSNHQQLQWGKMEEKGGGVCGRDKRMEGCTHRHPHRGREDFHRTSSDGDDPERRWERVPG